MAYLWILVRNERAEPSDIVVIYDVKEALLDKPIKCNGPNDDIHVEPGLTDVTIGDDQAPGFTGGNGHLSYACAFVQFALDWRKDERIRPLSHDSWPGKSVCDLNARSALNWRTRIYIDPDTEKHPLEKDADGRLRLKTSMLPADKIFVCLIKRGGYDRLNNPSDLEQLVSRMHEVHTKAEEERRTKRSGVQVVRPAPAALSTSENVTPVKVIVTIDVLQDDLSHPHIAKLVATLNTLTPTELKIIRGTEPGSTRFLIEIQVPSHEVEAVVERLQKRLAADIIESSDFPPITDGAIPLVVEPGKEPTPAEVYRFLDNQYALHRRNRVFQWLRDSLRLLCHVLVQPKEGFTAANARFFFVPQNLLAFFKATDYPGRAIATRALWHLSSYYAFLWPVLSFLCSVLLIAMFVHPADPEIYLWSAGTATIMAFYFGGPVCGAILSPAGVGAGGFVLSLFYSLMLAILGNDFHSLSAVAERSAPSSFVAIVHGIVGITASDIRTDGLVGIVFLAAIGIAAAAWLMGSPSHVDEDPEKPKGEVWTGISLGAIASGGIGVIFGLTQLAAVFGLPDRLAFSIIASFGGAAAYGISVFLRLSDAKGARQVRGLVQDLCVFFGSKPVANRGFALICALLYGISGAGLWGTTLAFQGTRLGLYLGGLGTAYFHASFFTLAYVIGLRAGGRKAAFLAAVVEGVGGFVVANLILILRA
jgi:hypothetical protein